MLAALLLPMNELSYKYDVAFSFLDPDEPLARQLSDSFEGRLSTFVYSECQMELAGKDGVEEFSRVFKNEARIVVILYRPGWGETPWTRLESTAIKERFLKKGPDFLLIVPVGGPSKKPEWFPDTRIWLDLDRCGLTKVSAIIEYRVRERGGEPKDETAVERAARLKRSREADEARQSFLKSQLGFEAARKEALQVVLEIERLSQQVSDPSRGVPLRFGRPNNATVQIAYEVSSYGFKVIVAWSPKCANDVTDAEFLVTLVRRSGYPDEGRCEELTHHVFVFDVLSDGVYVWKDTTHAHQSFPSLKLSDFCVKLLLDALERHKPWQIK